MQAGGLPRPGAPKLAPTPYRPAPPSPGPQEKLPTCPHVDDGSYRVSSSGFRLVHGDVCTGIDQIIADTDGKGEPRGGGGGPSRRRGGRGHGLFSFVMVAAALAGVGAAWYHFLASPGQRATAAEVGGAAAAFCSGLVALAVDAADTALAKLGAGFGGLRFGGGGGGGGGPAYEPLDEEVGAGDAGDAGRGPRDARMQHGMRGCSEDAGPVKHARARPTPTPPPSRRCRRPPRSSTTSSRSPRARRRAPSCRPRCSTPAPEGSPATASTGCEGTHLAERAAGPRPAPNNVCLRQACTDRPLATM
jgi:hypothetical protein